MNAMASLIDPMVWVPLIGILAALATLHGLTSEGPKRWRSLTILGICFVAMTLGMIFFAGFSCPPEKAGRARTYAFHRAVMSGLENYHNEFGEYPAPATPSVQVKLDGHDYDVSGALMLYQALSGDGNDKIKTAIVGTSASNGKLEDSEIETAFLKEIPREMIKRTEAGYILVDGFGHPFQYTPGGPESINETYDLWSFEEDAPVIKMDKFAKQAVNRWIKNW